MEQVNDFDKNAEEKTAILEDKESNDKKDIPKAKKAKKKKK